MLFFESVGNCFTPDAATSLLFYQRDIILVAPTQKRRKSIGTSFVIMDSFCPVFNGTLCFLGKSLTSPYFIFFLSMFSKVLFLIHRIYSFRFYPSLIIFKYNSILHFTTI